MTAGELIQILGQFSPDRRVVVDVRYGISEPKVMTVGEESFLDGLSTEEEKEFILITSRR